MLGVSDVSSANTLAGVYASISAYAFALAVAMSEAPPLRTIIVYGMMSHSQEGRVSAKNVMYATARVASRHETTLQPDHFAMLVIITPPRAPHRCTG